MCFLQKWVASMKLAEASDSKRPVAILPESCRPKEVLHFARETQETQKNGGQVGETRVFLGCFLSVCDFEG